MTTTPDLGIPLISALQSQPDVTHNEALLMLQATLVGAMDITNTPPGSPADGDLYICGTAPTGAWAGKANKLAFRYGGAWRFIPGNDSAGTNIPMGARHEGLKVWVNDEDAEYSWTGSAWDVIGGRSASVSTTISADQSLTQNAYTQIDFDTAVISPNAAFYTVDAAGAVTIIKPGVYIITALVYCENTGGTTQEFDVGFFAGGSLYFGEESGTPIAGGGKRAILRTGVLHVSSANTVVDVRVWTDGNSSKIESAPLIHGATPLAGNRLSIVRV